MESALKVWAVIVIVGALNYATRLSFIALFARRTMPPLLARTLKFVPVAMLTALIVPMVVGSAGQAVLATPRIVAVLIAAIVAFWTRSTLATLAAGMGVLWLVQAAAT